MEELDLVEKLITDRISENNQCKDMMTKQQTHAFMLYRSHIWRAKYALRDNIKEVK